LRKNRSEAFCGSSENILCATFWGFAFGREIEAQKLVLLLMFNRKTTVEFCTSARLTQNPCCAIVLF
jgi:hypothetical protein